MFQCGQKKKKKKEAQRLFPNTVPAKELRQTFGKEHSAHNTACNHRLELSDTATPVRIDASSLQKTNCRGNICTNTALHPAPEPTLGALVHVTENVTSGRHTHGQKTKVPC